MSGSRPDRILDPVCGMTVDVARAEADGLIVERDGRTYAFCGAACRRVFEDDPATYAAAADESATAPAAASAAGVPVIDDGMRRWYESCSCCLSDAYPDIKAALDAERAAASAPPVAAGICEVAEAQESPAPAGLRG